MGHDPIPGGRTPTAGPSELRHGPLSEIVVPWPGADTTTSSLLLRDSRLPDRLLDPLRGVLHGLGRFQEESVDGGEGIKTLEGWQHLLALFAEAQLDRDSVVVVAGGGSLGDAAGFAASTWHRGVSWVAVPTTLLAMVDAHIGGKTAINVAGIKNRVGAFHPPVAVLCDRAFLETLDGVEVVSGWVEMFKASVIGDRDLFEELCREYPSRLPSDDQLVRAVGVKLRIVSEDPFENGVRELLNLGHTLGHAIEAVVDPSPRHGEAVAIGLVFAALVAVELNLAPRRLVKDLAAPLVARGLHLGWPLESARELITAMDADKKGRAGRLRMVLPQAPGQVQIQDVPRELLLELLQSGLDDEISDCSVASVEGC